jgi:hypothetical protein
MQILAEVYIGTDSLPKNGQTGEIRNVCAVENIDPGLGKPV